ncbi:MAG: hypothetical protein KME17_25330 [Cyanosarcina radialis HA8281-LM2]|jgi:hypothetical protein|nr:hypothetical protein [Cyanosarcina radialis HA8281-LM2]
MSSTTIIPNPKASIQKTLQPLASKTPKRGRLTAKWFALNGRLVCQWILDAP